jgi:hypothetical protein
VTRGSKYFEWHLGGIERAKKLRKPKGHPQPVWFTPFPRGGISQAIS